MLSVLRDSLEILKRNNLLSEHCLQKEIYSLVPVIQPTLLWVVIWLLKILNSINEEKLMSKSL